MNLDFHENMRSPTIFTENGLESCGLFGIPSDYILIQSGMSAIDDSLLHMNSMKQDIDLEPLDHFQHVSATCDSISKSQSLYPMKFGFKSDYENDCDLVVHEKPEQEVVIEEIAEEEVISNDFDSVFPANNTTISDRAGGIPLMKFSGQSKLSYQCYRCGETFHRKKSLINHVHSHDTDSFFPKNAIRFSKRPETDILMTENVNKMKNDSWEHSSFCLHLDDNENSEVLVSDRDLRGFNASRGGNELGKRRTAHTGRKDTGCERQSEQQCVSREQEKSRDTVVCSLCGKHCKDDRGLRKHAVVHPDGQLLSCGTCGKWFYSRTRFKRHMLSHRDEGVTCLECGEKLAHQRDLANHRSCYHVISTRNGSIGRMFPCRTCNKVFSTRSCQQIHMRTHTGERPYSCSYCVKAFCDGGTLRKHERIHTGEKPYVCPICVKAFNQRVVLREHIRSHHTCSSMVRTLQKCDVCNEMFETAQDLCLHLVKHADENTAKQRNASRKPRSYGKCKSLRKDILNDLKTSNVEREVSVVTAPNYSATIDEYSFVERNDDYDKTNELESYFVDCEDESSEFHHIRIYVDTNENTLSFSERVNPRKWETECTLPNNRDSETHSTNVSYELMNSCCGKLPEHNTVESSCNIISCLNSVEETQSVDLNCMKNEFNH